MDLGIPIPIILREIGLTLYFCRFCCVVRLFTDQGNISTTALFCDVPNMWNKFHDDI